MTMRRFIQSVFVGFICLLPIYVQAQGVRQIRGTISMDDDIILDMASSGPGSTITCYVYSFYNKEEADKNLKDFNEHRINASDVPSSEYQDVVRVQLSNEKFDAEFKVEAVNDGYIVAFAGKHGYTITPEQRKVTKNMTPPSFTVIMKEEKSGGSFDEVSEQFKDSVVEVVASRLRGTFVSTRTVEEDGMLLLRIDDLPHPCHSRSNSRVIIQPYWLDGPDMGENKIFAYADPVVYDYKEYDCTQIRRMAFDKAANDKLSRYLVYDDTTRTHIKVMDDTIRLKNYVDTLSGHNPDESYPYPARAIISVEDYNEQYVLDTVHIDEGERTNYIKFLDFTYEKNFDVTIEDFREEMDTRPIPSEGSLSLNFEQSSARLNPADTMNSRKLEDVRNKLDKAFRQDGATLMFMQVYGYSSPDGSPQKNRDLARARADFALREIRQAIPTIWWNRIRPSESEILGWDVVADSLQCDGLTEEAQQVRDIVAKYPDDLVNQGKAMKKLSCYYTVISPIYLPKLRTIRYKYVKSEERTYTNEELKLLFEKGEDTEWKPAHYYNLIKYYWNSGRRNEPEVRMRLEQIAKRALVNTRLTKGDIQEGDSIYNDGYWALAANVLATSYIERDTSDLNLLRPFINRTVEADSAGNLRYAQRLRQKQNRMAGNREIGIKQYTNFPQIIAEQIIMLLMQPGRKNMEELGALTDMIENDPECMNNPDYSRLLALANCKRGYYRASANCTPERASRVRSEVSDISITNKVIMNIAMADSEGDTRARDELFTLMDDMPETSIANYLKAIIELLRPVPDRAKATEYLALSFKQDLRKMPIANNDQQLVHNRTNIIVDAFDKWEKLVKKEVTSRKPDVERLREDSLIIMNYKLGGTWDEMQDDYWIVKVDDRHPYYWYEKAVEARNTADEIELIKYLEQCVACNPDYLSVIRVARYADNEVAASPEMSELFYRFYLNELQKKRKNVQ